MERFLFLYKGSNMEAAKLSPKQMEEHNKKWYDWIGKLSKDGIHLAGEPLDMGGKVVAKKSGKLAVTDGPFPEAKEIVGGYSIINAKNIEEAAELAKGCPAYELGGHVEVRHIRKMDM